MYIQQETFNVTLFGYNVGSVTIPSGGSITFSRAYTQAIDVNVGTAVGYIVGTAVEAVFPESFGGYLSEIS